MNRALGLWAELAIKSASAAPEEPGPAAASPGTGLWGELRRKVDFAAYRPKVIDDLEVVHLDDSSRGPYTVVKNPRTLKYLRLEPEDYFLFERLDGRHSVRELVLAYFQQFKALALNRITGLLAELKADGFLDEPSARLFESLRQSVQRQRWGYRAGRLLAAFFHFPVVLQGLDGFLSWAYRHFMWVFFTRGALALYTIIAAVGLVLFVDHFTSSRFDLFRVGGSYELGLLALVLIDVLVIMLHEGAHAFATKACGRQVNRAGFLIYVGMPAFFVDTTDIWLEPKRSRIAVSGAGPFAELVMGGVCAILIAFWPAAETSEFLFKFAFFFYLGAFLNLNPLLELDGYYILMDWLEIPMLRARSMAFVKGPLWRRLARRERLGREERILAIYGLAAILYLLFAVVVVVYFWQAHLSQMLRDLWASGQWFKQVLAAAVFLGLAVPLGYVALAQGYALVRAVVRLLQRYRLLIEPERLAALLAVASLALAAPTWFQWTGSWDGHYRLGVQAGVFLAALAAVGASRRLGLPPLAAAWPWLALLAVAVGVHLLPAGVESAMAAEAAGYGVWLLISTWCLPWRARVGAGQRGARLRAFCRSVPFWVAVGVFAGLLLGTAYEYYGFAAAAGARMVDMDFIRLKVGAFLGAMVVVAPAVLATWRETRVWPGAVFLLTGACGAGLVWRMDGPAKSLGGDTASLEAWTLWSSLLVASACVHYLVQAGRLPWRKVEACKGDLDRDVDRITAAFQYLAMNLAASYSCLVGRWRAETALARAEAVLGMAIQRPEDRHGMSPDGDVVSLGRRYEEAIEALWQPMRWVVGPRRLATWVERLLEHVPWAQREAAVQYFVGKLDVEGLWPRAFQSRQARYRRVLDLNPILAELSPEEKQAVASHLTPEEFREGERIIRQGEPADKFYVIEDGPVEVLVRGADGQERSVALLGEGDYFGEIALVQEVARTASCVARGRVRVLSLAAEDFRRVVGKYFEALAKVDRALTRASLLTRIPLFRELDGCQIRALLSRLAVQRYAPGEVVIRQGDVADRFYIIAEGQVRVLVAADEAGAARAEGREVAQLGPGEYFGEIALLADVPRTATVRAATELEVLVLSKADFDRVLAAHLGMARHLEQVGSRRRLDTARKGRR